ncbi:hypothetical protein DOTSEDRAFT_25551 [Dothistroma septosporum NZE10]|uniref:Uncharacterized protein n=1 Tax=Dothistroma septosporum (strain NZE10 / CBS 128990) TaxID=675120 RepID=M2YPT0_DOTSN|nr:hypothetical protein DOTSEDRAFT_25551 [Dothistroma septosporum NZE10]
MATTDSTTRGIAFVIGFRDEPMSDELRDAPLIFERLGWETHEILLDSGDTLQQLTDGIEREIGREISGKDKQLLIFYAGHAMSIYEPQALGTWHARTSAPQCRQHVIQCDPELVLE